MSLFNCKAILPDHFCLCSGEPDDNFIVLSKESILQNEVYIKSLNRIKLTKEDDDSTCLEMCLRVRVLEEIDNNSFYVAPSLYAFFQVKDMLEKIRLHFKPVSLTDIPTGDTLKLRRCYSQLLLTLEEKLSIDECLITYFKRLGEKSANSFSILRDQMLIPIVYNNNVVWYKVVSDMKKDFKVQFNESIEHFYLDNETVEEVVSIKKAEYQCWFHFYDKTFQYFDYNSDIWPAYKETSEILDVQSTCFMIYSDTIDVGLYGKTHLLLHACLDKGLELVKIDFVDILEEQDTLIDKFNKIQAYCHLFSYRKGTNIVFYFKHVDLLFGDDYKYDPVELKIYQFFRKLNETYKLVFSSNNLLKTNFNVIRSLCLQEIKLDLVNELQRVSILEFLLQNDICDKKGFNLAELGQKTATFTPYELLKVKEKSSKPITQECLLSSINFIKKIKTQNNGAPKVPNVNWEDIGGLASVKEEIKKTINIGDRSEEKGSKNGILARSGILLFGVPGSGKTLLAKAIATNFNLNFFSVKGPELLNMYIGESEANIRRVFKKAYECKPCIIFFDELDSIAGKRNSHSGSTDAAMERVVGQLLNEIDEVNGDGDNSVFIVGATNRPDLLDEAFTRPGRFDKMVYLGVIDTREEQIKVLNTVTKKYSLDFPVSDLCHVLGFNYTGADYKSLSSKAVNIAIQRRICDLETRFGNTENSDWFNGLSNEEIFGNKEGTLYLTKEDFIAAIKQLSPSVSQAEIAHYQQLRDRYT